MNSLLFGIVQIILFALIYLFVGVDINDEFVVYKLSNIMNYDFIKFEVELRTQLLNELDIEAYIAFEGRLAEVNNEKKFLGQKAENLLLLIKEIRKIYFETDTTADAKKHYAIGMYLYSLNCLKYFREDKTMKDKLYFTASLYLNKFRDQ